MWEKLLNHLRRGASFPFGDRPDTACLVCRHVLEEGKPILRVTRDADGTYQFLCGKNHHAADARVIALGEMWDMDRSIGALKDMPPDCTAVRNRPKDAWQVYQA